MTSAAELVTFVSAGGSCLTSSRIAKPSAEFLLVYTCAHGEGQNRKPRPKRGSNEPSGPHRQEARSCDAFLSWHHPCDVVSLLRPAVCRGCNFPSPERAFPSNKLGGVRGVQQRLHKVDRQNSRSPVEVYRRASDIALRHRRGSDELRPGRMGRRQVYGDASMRENRGPVVSCHCRSPEEI